MPSDRLILILSVLLLSALVALMLAAW